MGAARLREYSMPPKPKTPEQEAKEARELLIKLGIPMEAFDKHEAAIVDNAEEIILQAETALVYYNTKGQGFYHQQCPICKREFAYNYRVTLGPGLKCSNECRVEAFKRIGITWSPTKKLRDRYQLARGENEPYDVPLTIPPDALNTLQGALKQQG